MRKICKGRKHTFLQEYKVHHIFAIVLCLAAVMMAQTAITGAIGVVANCLFKASFIFLLIGDLALLVSGKRIAHSMLYTTVFGVLFLFFFLTIYKYNGVEKPTFNAYLGMIATGFTFFLGLGSIISDLDFNKVIGIGKKNFPIVVATAIFSVLFLPNFESVCSTIDSCTYYESVVEQSGKWNFDILNISFLSMGGHTAYAFAIPLHIGELLYPNYGYGQTTVKLLLSLVTIFLFYKICKSIWPEKDEIFIILLTCIFMFSPAFFGISYLTSTDFPLLCYMTVFLYSYIYKNRPLKWISVLAVCFSKEIGVIIIGSFFAGEFLYELFNKSNKKSGLIKRMLCCFFNKRRVVEYSSVLCYAYVLMFGSEGWIKNLHRIFEKENELSSSIRQTYVWIHYPVFKIFEIFFMNFNWIIFPVICICVIQRLSHKRNKLKFNKDIKEKMWIFLPASISFATFCAINIAYFTYIHYRYIQLGQLFYVIMLGFFILDICTEKKIQRIILIASLGLFFIESYVTVDPITYLFFDHVNIGNGEIISTRKYWYIVEDEETGDGYYWEADKEIMSQFFLAEGISYNRECLGLQRVLREALTTIDYDQNKLIVLDDFGGWLENTAAQLFGVMSREGYWWDPNRKTITRKETSVPLNFCSDEELEQINNYNEIYYIEFPFNPFHKSHVLDEYKTYIESEVCSGRWKIRVYKIVTEI